MDTILKRLVLAGLFAVGLSAALGWRWHLRADSTVEQVAAEKQKQIDSEAKGTKATLPAPSSLSISDFERMLFPFLQNREYVKLGWKHDGQLRDTGPYINGKYYGTHPAVRVYYSPEVITWLESGRQGTIPDGAMIVKEQYPPPAIRHEGKGEDELWQALESWTVMVKDAAGSHDGWFWSNPAKGQEVVDNHKDFSHPMSGFGLYCIRCHASTQTPGVEITSPANEFTFASLRNIEGYPGEPLIFRVDDSWRSEDKGEASVIEEGHADSAGGDESGVGAGVAKQESSAHPACAISGGVEICTAEVNPKFLSFYGSIPTVKREQVKVLPPVTHDWVSKQRDSSQEFVTSNQCMSCHAGLLEPYGPTMFVPTGESAEYGAKGWNISPYGEWRWTPMGLAGRDPIFLAQLESELAMIGREFGKKPEQAEKLQAILQDTCLKCHGAMGHHQFKCDTEDPSAKFSLSQCREVTERDEHIGRDEAQYGALAREGISCMVCHRMQKRPQPEEDDRPYLQYFLETSVTGNLYFGPANELYGPFKDEEISPYAMQHALGITPKKSNFLSSSQMCGSCHTVTLPAIDKPVHQHEFDELNEAQIVEEFQSFHHHVEQATYLEWLNSEFENEFNVDNPLAKSCQDCHMSKDLVDEEDGLNLATLATRMAIIQDVTYPDAENLTSHKNLNIRVREKGFSRHNFSGLNLFLLELFDQFPDVLGVRKQDYMTGSKLDIEHARRNFLQIAREKTADIEVTTNWNPVGELTADVTVRNKAGHRFPSGVGFRRAFLEVLVEEMPLESDGEARIVWSSGRTDDLGVLVDHQGKMLQSELFGTVDGVRQTYQPHYEVITSSSQAQVYESLLCNADGRFTTSFLRGCTTVKDNRLLPRGWSKEGPGAALTGRYLEATYPQGRALTDAAYQDGSGSDMTTYRMRLPRDVDPNRLQVRATLYYQAFPPYYLQNLFRTAPEGKEVERLHFLMSHLDLEGSAIEDWKLMIATDTQKVTESEAPPE